MIDLENKTKSNCIFCGISLTYKNRTKEHIIPKSVFYSNKLVIREICKKCNNKLGKICEQPAIPYIKEMIAELILKGYPLKLGRRNRNKRYIKQGLAVNILEFKKKKELIPSTMFIDLQERIRGIDLHPDWVKKEVLNLKQNFPEKGTMIFPARENEGIKEIHLLSFKIIYELCYLLWKEKFLRTNSAEELKEYITKGKVDLSKTEILDPNIPLLNWDNKLKNDSSEIAKHNNLTDNNIPQVKSPFDNPPHITFAIIKPEDIIWLAVLNLYGMNEFTYTIFRKDNEMQKILEETKGVFLIIEQTGEKKIKKYTYNQYEEFKI